MKTSQRSLKNLLEKAGASFMRAFGGSIVTLAPGILSAPDLNNAVLLATAALISSITAGIKSIQVLVPEFTFGALFVKLLGPTKGQAVGAYADSFARAFLGTFLTLAPGVYTAPDLGSAKAAAAGLLVGAAAAGARAVEALFTKGESPLPSVGK